ncbi:hypothetical protein DP113_02110 [Brasilonema octagenarum UFV-E1]|uniref:Uncharacterized protein n=1 Tax=Brasilonema sennae CENA114 TaxID=415709 RepID=A0A856M902_9CYAN|nr:hypothetical protein [Brasilonema sennae]QDL06864.1 hypothetical protein DP114_02150 [Brasilonema sennae CENA114]QDL13228.1 hypothetical protein DP113_02110 [Brasilonema octagenarum UFV-E1]
MQGKKRDFQAIGLSVSLFAASTIGLLVSHTAVQAQKPVPKPTVATVKSMSNGDLMCYVNLVDEKGKQYNSVGASPEICAKEKRFLNKKVQLSYSQASVNDCQSAEPCGKSRIETLITKMQIIR